MRARTGKRLRFPGKEMVPAKGKGELAEVCRRKLVDSGHVQALDERCPRCIERLDEDDVIIFITMYRGIEWVYRKEHLGIVFS